jgi:epoxyqueuosine reductase QueG
MGEYAEFAGHWSALAKGGAAQGVRFPLAASANEHRYLIRLRGDKSSVNGSANNPQAQSGLSYKDARALAIGAGFAEAGLVSLPYAAEARDAERFNEFVTNGRAGTMGYLQRKADDGQLTRSRVGVPFPWARSAIVCFASYLFPDAPLSTKTIDPRSGWIARYAWTSRVDEKGARRPSDYHKVLLKRLKSLDASLRPQFGDFESRAYVDTGPVVERSLAVAAGVGWSGKNTCLINPKLGSWGFLAVLITSLEVSDPASQQVSESAENQEPGIRDQETEGQRTRGQGRRAGGAELISPALQRGGSGSDKRVPKSRRDAATALLVHGSMSPAGSFFEIPDRCGSCTRCIEACPTNALDNPYQMNATRCIAYLTIEHKGPIAEELMSGMGRQVFGCDICQDVCPWNGKALRSGPIVVDPELEPRPELINPALERLAAMDELDWEKNFNGSPVRRAGFNGLRRNVAIAMGNSGLAQFVPRLEEWAGAADEGVRSAARWALERLAEQTRHCKNA